MIEKLDINFNFQNLSLLQNSASTMLDWDGTNSPSFRIFTGPVLKIL